MNLENDAVKRFKRQAIGFFRRTTIKSLDETAQILYQSGIASSAEEGRKIVPLFVKERIRYGFCDEIMFEVVRDETGRWAYKISHANTTPIPGGAGLS